MTDKQEQIQGKSYSAVRESSELKITKFDIVGFNCIWKMNNHKQVIMGYGHQCSSARVLVQVLSNDGSTGVGKISKQWSGLVKEAWTDADNFGITCKPWMSAGTLAKSGQAMS